METKRKILIIDDEPDILEFLSYNFRKHDFDVSIANDGKEGIQKVMEVVPEIIISDILMPQMDGIEMCKQIRKTSEFNSTPFLFLTAVNDDYKVLYAMTSGADQFASKPIRFEYLLKMVEDMLSERKVVC